MKQKSKTVQKFKEGSGLNFCKKAISLHTLLCELVALSGENRRSRGSKYEPLKRAEGQKARSPRIKNKQKKFTEKHFPYLMFLPQSDGLLFHSSSPVEAMNYDTIMTFWGVYWMLFKGDLNDV